MSYVRVCRTVNDKGKLVDKAEFYADPYSFMKTSDKEDWYVSLFDYEDKHFDKFQETKTVTGMEDVVTDRLLFDFDSADIDKAHADAHKCVTRLTDKAGIEKDAVSVYFSGNKGFHVEVFTNERYSPEQIKGIVENVGVGLDTLDTQIYNASRIVRFPGTKHQVSGLYKTKLTQDEFLTDVENIKVTAATSRKFKHLPLAVSLPERLQPSEVEETINDISADVQEIDFTRKPRGWNDAKFALLNGLIPRGLGHNAFLCLAAMCKSMGYPDNLTIHTLQGVNELREKRGFGKHDESDIRHSIGQVYSPRWNGGTYSVLEQGWLRDYAIKNGFMIEEIGDIVTIDEAFDVFKLYAQDFEKNIILTGIDSLDKRAKFLVGTSNAILGAPSSGKTSILVNILNYTNQMNLSSVFFSYDMYHSLVVTRLIQRHFRYSQENIFKHVREDTQMGKQFKDVLKREYAKVNFCFKSGQTTQDIERTIVDTQQRIGDKVKLVAIDYNELIATHLADDTSSSAKIAQELRRIANDHSVCVITLLQPSKVYADPSQDVTKYSAAKGSSSIAQAVTLMYGINRPGWNPRKPEEDRFMAINCLKNRMGSLFSHDFGFDGMEGTIKELSNDEQQFLDEIRERKKEEQEKSDAPWRG